jgi:hypothetical protein
VFRCGRRRVGLVKVKAEEYVKTVLSGQARTERMKCDSLATVLEDHVVNGNVSGNRSVEDLCLKDDSGVLLVAGGYHLNLLQHPYVSRAARHLCYVVQNVVVLVPGGAHKLLMKGKRDISLE